MKTLLSAFGPSGIDGAFTFDRRRLVWSLGALAASLALRPIGAGAAEQAGAVQEVRGEAFVQAGEARRPLQPAAAVFIKDQVGTGPDSRLNMRLGRGRDTTLRVGERAMVTIDEFLVDAGGEINLQAGPLLLDRPPKKGSGQMRIRTPYGVIAVRGTRVFVGPSKDVYGVFVERGSVTVLAAGRRVTLRRGEGTDIRNLGSAPTPPARWKIQRIRAALASVN